MNIGEIIKRERLQQGMSQKELAKAAGVTTRAIIYWENGERNMSVENADKILRALHMSVIIGQLI